MHTGHTCGQSGYYICCIHRYSYLHIEKGEPFPERPHGLYEYHKTLWIPARKVSSIVADLKNNDNHL